MLDLTLGSPLDPGLADQGQRIDHSTLQAWLEGLAQGRAWTRLDLLPQDIRQRGHYWPGSQLWPLLLRADRVWYRDQGPWPDPAPDPEPPLNYDHWHSLDPDWQWGTLRILTECLVQHLARERPAVLQTPVPRAPLDPRLALESGRVSAAPQIWIAGCSIAHGLGILPDQRWGHQAAQELSRPVSWLTRRGSSLEWQSDQIQRADLAAGDWVIWGLTSELRMPQSRRGHIVPWPGSEDRSAASTVLFDETQWYRAITQIQRTRRMCALLGAHLVLLPCLSTERMWHWLSGSSDLCAWPWQPGWLDLGRDQWHPGPQQHRVWARAVVDHCRRLTP